MKVVSFENLFKSSKTWLSGIKWGFLLPVWIGFMLHLFLLKYLIWRQNLVKQDIYIFHKTCKCKCRLNASVCNNKQRWNKDEYRCECRELIEKDVCDDGFIWNPRVCEYRSDKLCDVGEYIDYPNYKCRKRLIDKLVFPWI